MLNNVNICVANHVNMFICFIYIMEKKIMKQISNANELVRSARKQTHVEQYGSGLVHAISVYQDKETNKEYLVDIDMTDTSNIKIHSIEEIINEVAQ